MKHRGSRADAATDPGFRSASSRRMAPSSGPTISSSFRGPARARRHLVTEQAVLDVRTGEETEFEAACAEATKINGSVHVPASTALPASPYKITGNTCSRHEMRGACSRMRTRTVTGGPTYVRRSVGYGARILQAFTYMSAVLRSVHVRAG